MDKMQYFFFEWLIIEKGMTEEQYKKLTQKELKDLKNEWINAKAIVLKLR